MTQLTVFNNLTRKKETFSPQDPNNVSIYTCGPTVYDHSHIGHARSAVTWDTIVRFMKFFGYKVTWTRNITDIDDKIINKAKEINIHPDKVSRIYTYSFHEDMLALNVEWPDFEPRATQHLSQMYDFINSLIKNGAAYRIDNDVYFSVTSFKNYGKLKGQSINELEKGFGRIESNPKKKHKLDFALWKGIKEPSEYAFDSPWGKGRPGWHLECSAMNLSIYGETIDIHGGGDDLVFPHHENEIAQSESLTGKTFARYWLHNGMIMVDGKKMAKSEGNFITIKQALRNTTSNALRFFILNSHYRMPLNFTEEAISAAQNGINRLVESLDGVESENFETNFSENEFVNEFRAVMSDDFNSPKALSVLFKLTDKINTEKDQKNKTQSQNTLLYLSNILGFNLLSSNKIDSCINNSLSKLIENLVHLRNDFKTHKDYKNADKIRDILNESKIEVKDLAENKYKWQIKP
ncbi:MAG: cysteine--tRNA ligase [Candidatus Melainabacteria bacterium RIFCSPHIGHO2_02_FULL_34_12]|nr:MAG: cysteine--tRNA ligase [Candidatus Melainabacteria bacterium RIFCSPHIGHO2_02_FULL_34_12]